MNETLHSIYDKVFALKNTIPGCRYSLRIKNKEIQPFFIVGSGRSGTTLLRRTLIQAEGVHIPPETYVLGKVIKLFRQNAGMKWPNLVNLVLATIEYQPDFDTFNVPNLEKLSARLRNLPKEERSLATLLDYFYKYHAELTGSDCNIWGDKTPYNTFFLDRINKTFPKAKYIYLVRNGYDVIYSYVKTGLYNNHFDAAKRWELSNKKALKFLKKNPHKVLTVHYEDFVENPEECARAIFEFLNIEFENRYVQENYTGRNLGDVDKKSHHYNVLDQINTNSVGKGKEKIPLEIIGLIENIVEPIHQILHYK